MWRLVFSLLILVYFCYTIAVLAPPPPLHAINRGIGIEGLGTILAGLFGSGNGTNTFGENVGAIGVTKVNNRLEMKFNIQKITC